MPTEDSNWFVVQNVSEIPSPALLVYPDRITENVDRMLAITGGPERLRPHIKTHKMPAVMEIQIARGITKFKAATIAETEMAAEAGASDILLAYQPVGPNIDRFIRLIRQFSNTRFSAIVDDAEVIRAASAAATAAGVTLDLMLDIDCGQHRSGIEPGPEALELYRLISSSPGLRAAGLHVYDGHLFQSDSAERSAAVHQALAPVHAFRSSLEAAGLPVPNEVAGGTPTFPIHAARADVECSPGTCVLSDHQYDTELPDLDFLLAAMVLCRVASKPLKNRICLDLGHKAVAAEKPQPRVHFPMLPDAKFVVHSEEHLVAETSRAGDFKVGDVFYGVPMHICPTVALYSEAVVVRNGQAVDRWKVTARDRRITI